MEKLDLEPNKKLSDLVFISPKVLEIQTECGGVTLQNDKEIFFASPGSKLVKEKETQTNLNSKEVEVMVKKLEELNNKYNQLLSNTSNILYPEANIPALAIIDEHLLSQAQEVITKLNTLRVERNQLENQNGNLQQTITTLQNEITQLSNALQTTQQEKDQLQQSLKISLIGSLFKNKKKVKRVSQLNDSLRLLRGLLTNKIQQIDNLTNNRNNLQTQINDLNQQLTNANNTVTILQEELRKVKEDLKKWTDKFLIKTAEQIFEELKRKNKIIDELNKKKVNKETLAKDFRN